MLRTSTAEKLAHFTAERRARGHWVAWTGQFGLDGMSVGVYDRLVQERFPLGDMIVMGHDYSMKSHKF